MGFSELTSELQSSPQTWLVTGVAGFIGSNLLETLLRLDQVVVGLDNFSTGRLGNLEEVKNRVEPEQWERFNFIEGDIRDFHASQRACQGVNYVLHQAALGSVPRSLVEPLNAHDNNVNGFLNVLTAARDQQVKRMVFASSSAVYGDEPSLPKVEARTGKPLSPYAATKAINETYATVFADAYGIGSIGLRYFNVFGPRQDPEGAYAAVIPKWIAALIKNEPVLINGDGETSRDFCFVANVVQANLLAATAIDSAAVNQAYNIAVGERTTLNQLYQLLKDRLVNINPALSGHQATYQEFRAGDVRHSLADISKAQRLLGYAPKFGLAEGLDDSLEWYLQNVGQDSAEQP